MTDLRRDFVEQIERGCSLSPELAAAFATVPREAFVPEGFQRRDGTWAKPGHRDFLPLVYRDDVLVTKLRGRTPVSSSSQPSLMAVMIMALDVRPGLRILEIGAGTGYNAALLASLGATVTSVDVQQDVADRARAALARAGVDGVRVVHGDGYAGVPGEVFDRVIVTVGVAGVSPNWLDQVTPGSVVIAPIEHAGTHPVLAVRQAVRTNAGPGLATESHAEAGSNSSPTGGSGLAKISDGSERGASRPAGSGSNPGDVLRSSAHPAAQGLFKEGSDAPLAVDVPAVPLGSDGVPAVPFGSDVAPAAPLGSDDVPAVPLGLDGAPAAPLGLDGALAAPPGSVGAPAAPPGSAASSDGGAGSGSETSRPFGSDGQAGADVRQEGAVSVQPWGSAETGASGDAGQWRVTAEVVCAAGFMTAAGPLTADHAGTHPAPAQAKTLADFEQAAPPRFDPALDSLSYRDLCYAAGVWSRRASHGAIPGYEQSCLILLDETRTGGAVILPDGAVLAGGAEASRYATEAVAIVARWSAVGRPPMQAWQTTLGLAGDPRAPIWVPESWNLR